MFVNDQFLICTREQPMEDYIPPETIFFHRTATAQVYDFTVHISTCEFKILTKKIILPPSFHCSLHKRLEDNEPLTYRADIRQEQTRMTRTPPDNPSTLKHDSLTNSNLCHHTVTFTPCKSCPNNYVPQPCSSIANHVPQ